MEIEDLPRLEFADPGPLRDQVVAAILAGAKTTTTGLALDESVAEWRSAHEEEWHSAEKRAVLGDPGFTVGADTAVQAQRFRLVPAPPDGHGPAAEPGA